MKCLKHIVLRGDQVNFTIKYKLFKEKNNVNNIWENITFFKKVFYGTK